MNSFSDLIKQRRSMRKFTDKELTQDEVVLLLKAALMSPSSKRSNCWQFVVVDDKETLDKLSRCKEAGASFLKDAPLAIVVLADPLASDVWIEDASVASIMIQLQAEDMGLGSCWIQVRERFGADGVPANEYVHNVLDIPLSFRCCLSLLWDIREWNVSRSTRLICSGRKCISINITGESNRGGKCIES